MKYTKENIEKVAEQIVDGLDLKDLCQYVYDDIYATMEKDEEMFYISAESLNLDVETPSKAG